MRLTRLGWLVTLFLPWGLCAPVQAAAPQAAGKQPKGSAASPVLQPLERWRAAVLAGDKATLTSLYMTSPPARAKTPQGETLDPGEEPAFWSSLRRLGLTSLDIKLLEVKTLQPGVQSLVLRMQMKFRAASAEQSAIAEATQVWVQEGGAWRIIATQRSDLSAYVPRRLPEPAKPNPQLYPAPAEAPAEIAAALTAARKDHKRVILVFGGNWCYDCHVLDTTFRSKAVAPLVNENYHVVHVNVGEYNQNLDLAKKYGVSLDKGVPSLAVLDSDGKLLFSQQQGEFESTVRIGPEDVTAFLQRWKPQRGASD
jgi:thioredoxin 1